MLNVCPFKAILPKINLISSPDSFFGQVKEQYVTLQKAGYFYESKTEGFWVYQIKTANHTHIGLLAAVEVAAYLAGHVIKHEQTLAAKEEKTGKLIDERGAMIKPVLLAYPNVADISTYLKAVAATQNPTYTVSFKGAKHTLWSIDAPADITAVQTLFATQVPHTYIADGHHRVAAAVRQYQKNGTQSHILAALFSADELTIWDYNRVVEGLDGQTPLTLLAKIAQLCDIEPLTKATRPTQKHEFGMCLDGQWFLLRWREHILAQATTLADSLDVSLLDQKILANLLGIYDIRTDNRVTYWEGIKGLEVLAMRGRQPTVSFCLYPVAITDLMDIADSGNTMPPKSTWFEPRIKNGFVAMGV